MGNKSLADLPELRTMSLIHPTKDSIMYFTPCNRSSELNPNEAYIFHVEIKDCRSIVQGIIWNDGRNIFGRINMYNVYLGSVDCTLSIFCRLKFLY